MRPSILAAGIVAACATLFGLFETLQYYARSRLWGRPYDWTGSLAENALTAFILAALTPIAFVMSRRFRIERRFIGRRLVAHMVAGLTFAVLAVAAIAWFLMMRNPAFNYPLAFGKVGTFYILFYLALYWTILGALHAIHYQRQAQTREEQLTRERLNLLRTKLNPHFLFNTLNAISTMSLQRNHDGVAESIGHMSDILRASLDESLPHEIPLRRELELIDKYVAIQRIRFGNRLRFDRAIDPQSLDVLVPSMLLQPIVENGIVHGVAAKPGAGWVRIESSRMNGHLHVVVSDSGTGFTPSPRTGLGLALTRERLATMYGDAHRLEIGSVPDGGARVEIVIPVKVPR